MLMDDKIGHRLNMVWHSPRPDLTFCIHYLLGRVKEKFSTLPKTGLGTGNRLKFNGRFIVFG